MPRQTARIPSLLVVGSFLAACAGGDSDTQGGGWEFVQDTVADTVVVRTVSGSVWGDSVALVPEVSIGEFEGADEYLFGSLSSIDVGQDGTIYALDSQVPALRVYDSDGVHQATWGREGEGPGEYKQPRIIAVRSDDRVLVRDPGNGRIMVFGPDGQEEDTWQIRGNFSTSRPLYVDHLDNAYYMLLLDAEAELSDWEYGLVRIHPDGTFGDTLRPPEFDWEEPFVEAKTENSWSRNTVPFSPQEDWQYSPDGYFVSGLSTRYAVTLHKPGGLLQIQKEYEPVPVLAAEKAYREDRIIRSFRRMVGTWRWNGPAIPDQKPPYNSFFVDDDGRVWVRVSQRGVEEENPGYDPEEEGSRPTTWSEPSAFDVFDADGRYLGHVRPSEGLSRYPAPVARGEYLWGVVRDELDVQRIVRFHIQVPGAEDGATTD